MHLSLFWITGFLILDKKCQHRVLLNLKLTGKMQQEIGLMWDGNILLMWIRTQEKCSANFVIRFFLEAFFALASLSLYL